MATRLELKLASGHSVAVEVPGGKSLDQELNDLRNREGRFQGDWIEVKTAANASRYVRYDQVVEILAVLG